MPESLISVCLPVYNGARYLAESIESVLAQTYTNFELLIGDDGSSDESAEICLKYAKQDTRIHFWRNATTLGLFPNYNRCMNNARGEFIKPFAQDDILHPQMLAKTLAVFRDHDEVSLISVGRRWIDESGTDISRFVKSPRAEKYIPADRPIPGAVVIRKALSPVTNFIGEPLSVVFRAEAKGDGFDEELAHIGDLEYWLRLLHQHSFYFLSDKLCSYRSHPYSATRKNWDDLMITSDFLKISKKCAWAFDEVGICKEEFEAQTIRSAAFGAACLWDAQQLDAVHVGDPLSAELSVTPRERVLLQVIAGLSSLQSPPASRAAAAQPVRNLTLKNADSIRILERRLGRMLSSKSWILTRPLREINRFFGAGESEIPPFDKSQKPKDIDQQRAYIAYLKSLIGKIRSSKSWRVSAALRSFTL